MYQVDFLPLSRLKEAIDTITVVFNEFEAPMYTKEGNEHFFEFCNIKNLTEMIANEKMSMYFVSNNGKIVGVLGIRDINHISLLFVIKEYHKKGIGKLLIDFAKGYCEGLLADKDKKTITVNSSPYAVEFYKKCGFKETSKEEVVDGIKFTKMYCDI